jgi:hypothetical protein
VAHLGCPHPCHVHDSGFEAVAGPHCCCLRQP